MNYGLYLAASGALTSLHRLDVAANNLANASTPSFKKDYALLKARPAARIEDDLPFLPSNLLLERLGAGPLLDRTRVDFTPGAVQKTGNPLDVAIQGEGFLLVRAPASPDEAGDDAGLRFTRDGRLTLDGAGRLVQAATGLPVLDVNDQPIFLGSAADVRIEADGDIVQGGRAVARLQIARPPDSAALTKEGQGLYRASPQAIVNRQPAAGTLLQGALEQANVDPIQATMAVSKAAGAVASNVSMIRAFDQLMDRAINGLGRVG